MNCKSVPVETGVKMRREADAVSPRDPSTEAFQAQTK